jgi:hypothetical protein
LKSLCADFKLNLLSLEPVYFLYFSNGSLWLPFNHYLAS